MNLGESQLFANHYEMILEWIVVIHETLWNDSGFNLGDSRNTLKWFWGESWWYTRHFEMTLGWISANLGDSWTKRFWGESLWLVNHKDLILVWILVIHEPCWIDSRVNLCKSWWFTNHSEITRIKLPSYPLLHLETCSHTENCNNISLHIWIWPN